MALYRSKQLGRDRITVAGRDEGSGPVRNKCKHEI
jgi:hypothetical protein